MKKKFVLILIPVLLIMIGVSVYWVTLSPLDRHGSVDLSQGKLEQQISQVVGRLEAGSYLKRINEIAYPGVNEYELTRTRGVDAGNERDINFSTSDPFKNVVAYYENKERVTARTVTHTTDVSGAPTEPYQTADFALNTGNTIQLNLTENKKKNVTDVWFREIL